LVGGGTVPPSLYRHDPLARVKFISLKKRMKRDNKLKDVSGINWRESKHLSDKKVRTDSGKKTEGGERRGWLM